MDTKYFYVTHSELNAILNYRGGDLGRKQNLCVIVSCNECSKAIIQSGIREIIYDSDKYGDTPAVIASRKCWMRRVFIIAVIFGAGGN